MADSNVDSDQINVEVEQTKKQEGLRYLGFVHVAAMQALVCLSRLYDFAKENSGPLKPGVQTVEGTVKAVVGPVYDKFHDVPFDILKFVDRKVGDTVGEVERYIPSLVKEASTQAYTAAQKAPEMAREVQRAGVIPTAATLARAAYSKAEPTAKTLYTKYEPVAEHCAVSAWKSLNKLPVFPQVVHVVLPTATYWTDKYNRAVQCGAERGYGVAAYLPVVPVERIAKVFGENQEEAAATAAAASQ